MLARVSSTAPSTNDSDPGRGAAWWPLALILAVSAGYEWQFIHYGINRIDESWQLYAAMRLHAGGTLYEDVFWVFPPGHLLAAWIAWWLDPPGLVGARVIYAIFNVALCGGIYALARRMMDLPFAVLAALLVALAAPRGHAYQVLFGYRYLIFCVLALLAFDRRLRGGGPWWMVISGALAGIALAFRLTPAFSVSCGIAVGLLATHRAWRNWLGDGLRYALGLTLAIAPVLIWLASSVGLERVWNEVVLHPLAMLQPLPLPQINPAKWTRRSIAALFVAIQFRAIWVFYFGYGVTLAWSWVRHWRRGEHFPHGLLVAAATFGAVFFIRSTGRSDEPHLDSVIPPVCLLVAHCLGVMFRASWPAHRSDRQRLIAASALSAGALAVWIYLLAIDVTAFPRESGMRALGSTHQHLVVRPIHKSIDIDRTTRLLRRVTKPDDTILNLGPTPLFHILSRRSGPGYFDVVMPGTFVWEEDEIWFLEHLKANPPAAVVWPLRKFDKMESRSIRVTAPRIVEWVKSTYAALPDQRRWVVMVRREDSAASLDSPDSADSRESSAD